MTHETHGFIRLPPDSTGKRIAHSVLAEVSVNNATDIPAVGEKFSLQTSNIVGTISEVEDLGGNSYALHLTVSDPYVNNALPILGENFLQNGIQIAVVSDQGHVFFIPQNTIAGGSNNIHLLDIDKEGAASVRFTEGSPNFDAFGKLQNSTPRNIGEYTFLYDLSDSKWHNIQAGTSSATLDSTKACMVLSVGTSAGDVFEKITHNYHHYSPGISMFIAISAQFGDAGKTGNERVIGYSDELNGVAFKLDDETFGVRIKSNASGTPVSIFVPKTAWNRDRLDGSDGTFNSSGLTLDLTKINTYWIDIQWLGGSGRVRFGIFNEGNRIVCHEMNHSNSLVLPFMPLASLPVYLENKNTGATASTSELRVWSAVVQTEGYYAPSFKQFSFASPSISLTSETAVPLISFKMGALYKGKVNRVSAYAKALNVFSTNAPFILQIVRGATLTTPSWGAADAESALQVDSASTSLTGGDVILTKIINTNDSIDIDLSEIFNEIGEVLRLNQDGVNATPYTITGRLLSAGSTNVYFSPYWHEIA